MPEMGVEKVARIRVMTTTERDALAAVEGMVIFNSTTDQLEEYDGATWQAVGQVIMDTHEALTIAHGAVDDIADQTDIATHKADVDAHHKLTVWVPFSRGSDARLTGYLIDANTEYADAWLQVPPDATKVTKIRVFAESQVAEADHMRVEFAYILACGDNEAYNTHSLGSANVASITENFAANDIVYWELSGATYEVIVGGDTLLVEVKHEAAGDGDCETNAKFKGVEIEYE